VERVVGTVRVGRKITEVIFRFAGAMVRSPAERGGVIFVVSLARVHSSCVLFFLRGDRSSLIAITGLHTDRRDNRRCLREVKVVAGETTKVKKKKFRIEDF